MTDTPTPTPTTTPPPPRRRDLVLQKLPAKTRVWREFKRACLMVIGAALTAFGYVVFQVPFNIAAGGLTGVAIIINYFTGWPLGLMFWAMNIPLLVLGYFYLGRWPFLLRTLFAATVFSVLIDLFEANLPIWLTSYPLTDDILLNAIYGGIVGGIGLGMIFRAGSTIGSTGIIGRILQRRTGQPLSQVYFYTDGTIILVAGLVFGWDIALYAFLLLFISGMASDYTMEGPSSTRTATIITDRPQDVADGLITRLNRGASFWEITGGFTGRKRYLVLCTITRSQVADLTQVVADIDHAAFVTIGVSHQALGAGFLPLRRQT
jgi:uncharacterized membrane-anchored protein YitT (DUF2179 family)